jgi:hypothetical protein
LRLATDGIEPKSAPLAPCRRRRLPESHYSAVAIGPSFAGWCGSLRGSLDPWREKQKKAASSEKNAADVADVIIVVLFYPAFFRPGLGCPSPKHHFLPRLFLAVFFFAGLFLAFAFLLVAINFSLNGERARSLELAVPIIGQAGQSVNPEQTNKGNVGDPCAMRGGDERCTPREWRKSCRPGPQRAGSCVGIEDLGAGLPTQGLRAYFRSIAEEHCEFGAGLGSAISSHGGPSGPHDARGTALTFIFDFMELPRISHA